MLYTLDPPALVQKLEGHECGVRAVVFTPDGKLLVSASCDQTVKLWDVKDGARLASMARHKDAVEKITLSPDGLIIASSSRDLTVKLWGLPAGNFLHTLETNSPDPLLEIVFSPDGSGLLSRDTANTLRLWALDSRIMTANPEQLLDDAERATGLKVLGMKLHPWKPSTGQVSAAPMPQGL
jgi:WD40 repeat protein